MFCEKFQPWLQNLCMLLSANSNNHFELQHLQRQDMLTVLSSQLTAVQLNVGHRSTSYNMAARALADLSHEGAKCPSAINQLSARAAML